MNNLQEKAKQLYTNPLVSDELNAYNQAAYIKAMEFLGDKHILAKPVERKQ